MTNSKQLTSICDCGYHINKCSSIAFVKSTYNNLSKHIQEIINKDALYSVFKNLIHSNW